MKKLLGIIIALAIICGLAYGAYLISPTEFKHIVDEKYQNLTNEQAKQAVALCKASSYKIKKNGTYTYQQLLETKGNYHSWVFDEPIINNQTYQRVTFYGTEYPFNVTDPKMEQDHLVADIRAEFILGTNGNMTFTLYVDDQPIDKKYLDEYLLEMLHK